MQTNASMTGPYFVGIDCGTQSAKVVIFDKTGRAVAEGKHKLQAMSRPRVGVAVHPEDDLWDSIAIASRQAMSAFKGEPTEIQAVGLCMVRCCKTFLKADGSLLEPVVSWMDDRAYQPYLPSDPELVFASTSSGYIAHRFTGEFKDTAANNLLLQWPIDTDTWQWSDNSALYKQFGVSREMLMLLQMPGDVIGRVTSKAFAATGIPEGIAVVQTANDKAVEMLGAGSLGQTTALISLGTYIAAMVHGEKNYAAPVNFWTNFSSIPGRYLYESYGVRRGMWMLTWFLDLLGDEFAERAAQLGLSREEYIEREAAQVGAGSDGLMTVLDWLAPTDKPFRKGSMLGFDARHTRGHMYRSILEAIALTMKQNVDAMSAELGITLTEIVVSGGGSNSPLFMQIFADVFSIPASRSNASAGASLGAAVCAAAATNLYPDIETAAKNMARERETFFPDSHNTAVYAQLLESVYQSIRSGTDAIYQRTHPIFL